MLCVCKCFPLLFVCYPNLHLSAALLHRTYSYAMLCEVVAFVLLPFVYIGMYTADKKYFVADSAAG